MSRGKVTKYAKSPPVAPPASEPQPNKALALDTQGYAAYRNRSASLFMDDAILQELQGRNAERTIDRMLLDPVIAGIVERTALTLRGAGWTVEPGGDADIDKRFADRIGQDLDELETGFPSTIASMADSLAWGFTLFEVLFEKRADGFHWADFSPREQRSIDHWDVDDGTGRLLQVWQRVQISSSRYNTPRRAGMIPIPGWKLIHFRTHPASGRPEGRSLIRNAFIGWADKQELRRILKVGLRRDFTGVAKYEVPAEILSKGATPEQKAALASAVQMVQEFERDQREGLVLPSSVQPGTPNSSGYKFELIQSGGRRPLDLTEIWQLHNREIAIGLLAEFALMGLAQVGTQALAQTKVSFFERAINAWLDITGEVMGHKAAPVYQTFNPQFATAKLPKFVHGDVDKRSLGDIGMFMAQVLAGGGIVPDPALEEWLRDTVGAPQTLNTTLPDGYGIPTGQASRQPPDAGAENAPASTGKPGAAGAGPANAAVQPVT